MPGSDPPSRSGSTYRIAVIRRSATTITVLARSRGRCGTHRGGNEDRDFGARAAEPTSSDPSEWWDAVDATRGGPRTCRRVAARRHARRGAAVLGLPARAVLLDPLRLLRLQHLHRRRARSGRAAQLVRRPGDRRGPARPSGARRRGPAGADGLRRRWHADAAARRRPGSAADARRGPSSGWPPDAEVTTEANPDSVDGAVSAASCGRPGFTRVSFGMQSAAPHVLAVLDRTHTPGRAVEVVARGAGGRVRARQPRPDLRHAGGDRADFAGSLQAAVDAGVDHVSAYALIVEDGTRLGGPDPAR